MKGKNVESEESILPFAYRLTIGRDSAKEYEGVEGAMEAGVHEPLYSLADSHWQEIKNYGLNLAIHLILKTTYLSIKISL